MQYQSKVVRTKRSPRSQRKLDRKARVKALGYEVMPTEAKFGDMYVCWITIPKDGQFYSYWPSLGEAWMQGQWGVKNGYRGQLWRLDSNNYHVFEV